MGLLDTIFPNSDGGGLLDFLKRNAALQPMPAGLPSDTAQYGNSPAPMNAMAQAPISAPSVPANPPAVIPASGPIGAPVPAAANPAVAPAPVALSQPGLMTGYENLRHGGGLIGSLVAGFTGQRNDDTGIALQQQAQTANYTARALIAKGVNPQVAIAAVQPGNAEMLKTLITQAYGQPSFTQEVDKDGNVWNVNTQTGQKTVALQAKDDKFGMVKTGADAMGRENYGVLNQKTGEVTPYKAPGAEDVGSGLPGDITKTGDDYINSLPKQYQGIVRGFVEGTARMPQVTTKNQAAMQNYFDMAKQADPSFDATNYSARQKGMQSFKSGQDATTVRSANQVLGHISDLADKADKLNNTRFPLLNSIENAASSAVGNDAANNWVIQAHAVADELSGFMKGAGHNSDSEIRAWNDSLTPNMSPQQQRGAIQTLMGIYQHALQALEDKRTASIGPMAAEKMGPLLTPSGQAAAAKIQKWANPDQSATSTASGAPAIQEGATASNPKTGQRIVYKGGQWVPLQ